MASFLLTGSPATGLATRRASNQQRSSAVVRSCRPRGGYYSSTGDSFFNKGAEAFGRQYGNAEVWRDLAKLAEKAFAVGVDPEQQDDFKKAATKAATSMTEAVAFPVDIVESATEYVLTADVPGLSKGDLKIRVNEDNRTLTIAGERRRAAEPQVSLEGEEPVPPFNGKRTFERRMGKFERTFNLSKKADTSNITARVEKGVLTLTVQKVPEPEPQVKDIPIWD